MKSTPEQQIRAGEEIELVTVSPLKDRVEELVQKLREMDIGIGQSVQFLGMPKGDQLIVYIPAGLRVEQSEKLLAVLIASQLEFREFIGTQARRT
jgi:hypothetical protein